MSEELYVGVFIYYEGTDDEEADDLTVVSAESIEEAVSLVGTAEDADGNTVYPRVGKLSSMKKYKLNFTIEEV